MKLSELVDIDKLRELCESYTAINGAVTAILELNGDILIATGWKDICTKFHRIDEGTLCRCRESDTVLAARLAKGESYNIYRCKNGLVDVAVPIIIRGEHVANFFTGQFFTESPDREFFVRQAEQFGFDKTPYLEALSKVPVFSEESVRAMMRFFTVLVEMIAEMGLARKEVDEANQHLEQRIAEAVLDSRKKDQMLILQGRQAAMGEMIGNIAHQWRQPLNTLGLIVQEMRVIYSRGEFSKEYLDASVKKAMEWVSYMSKTIDDFSNYFKPSNQKVLFSVNQVVAKTVSLVEPSLKKADIHIDVIEKDEIDIHGYPNEYSQVLLNILLNCRDAFERSGIAMRRVVTITILKEDHASVVTVADNAGGIAEDILDKIFDPYFTTKGPEKGTGIGLYMAKAIIENNMHGKLSVRNLAAGVEFRIQV